ncbi:MAG: tetratricopeptide repeat protein [Cyanobacteria bacterium CRU_2_1]|nr:tetratricopeptide repeat protein [Cyanobacteria bacterium CRU_2_1]
MGVSVEVNKDNFVAEVAEASHQRPVLVDFYAQWCGPCQMLKPMLEKLAQEYDFVLAKVDIDRNPELASVYKVEGVPDVRIVSQGKMYQGFVGVLPEPQLRQLLSQLNLKSDFDKEFEQVEQAIASGHLEHAQTLLTQLSEHYPQNGKITIASTKLLIQQGNLVDAERLLAMAEDDRESVTQVDALRNLLQLKFESQNQTGNEFDEPFAQAIDQTIAEEYELALQGFLHILSTDRKYRNDAARKAMLIIFDLLGDAHPLSKQYRKQLTLTLF